MFQVRFVLQSAVEFLGSSINELIVLKKVCREWQSFVDSKFDETKLVNAFDSLKLCPDRDDSMVSEFKNDWYCYLNGSFGLPGKDDIVKELLCFTVVMVCLDCTDSPDENYVFSTELIENSSDFVVVGSSIKALNAPSNELWSLARAMQRASSIGSTIRRNRISLNAWGSEGGSWVSVLVFPWNDGQQYTPEQALKALGAHPEISGTESL